MTPSLDIARIQAVLFDIDGTLADTDDDYTDRLIHLLERIPFLSSRREPHDLAREIITRTETPANFIKAWLDRLYIDEAIGSISDHWHRQRGGDHHNQLTLLDGISDMLDRLKGRYPLAVVTARERRSSLSFLKYYNLSHYFECVVTARSTLRSKPHPAPILHAARLLNVPVENCVMIGDTTVDMRSSRAAGSQSIGVLCGFGQQEELLRSGAAILLENTHEVADLLMPDSVSLRQLH